MLLFVKVIHDKLCETFSIVFHSLYVWYQEILTNLVIFRLRLLFLEFKNHSTTRSWSCFRNKIFGISLQFQGKASHWLNNMNMISPLNLFHYLYHLQFKFDLNQKIPLNAINYLNIANRSRNIPKLNMEYHMLNVESRKCFKARSEKKLIISCSYSSNSMYIN